VVLLLSASNSNALEVDPTLNSKFKLARKRLLVPKRDLYLSMVIMVTSNALIPLLSVKLSESHIAQETVWEEETVSTINVFAIPVLLVSIVVYISKRYGSLLMYFFNLYILIVNFFTTMYALLCI